MWWAGLGDEEEQDYERRRTEMVERQLRRRGIVDQRVLDALLRLPRHEFIGHDFRAFAYEDRPLPIGGEQTISQPYMVAAMTEALELRGSETVLEIGTGSGYQTAVLAMLAARVYTIERDASLLRTARRTLERIGLAAGIEFIEGDGSEGYPPAAPYDAILVAAAAPGVPPPLREQLADAGRLVVPVGARETQQLLQVRRTGRELEARVVNECRFVPLLGAHGWRVE